MSFLTTPVTLREKWLLVDCIHKFQDVVGVAQDKNLDEELMALHDKIVNWAPATPPE
jgi:hypothetical protein